MDSFEDDSYFDVETTKAKRGRPQVGAQNASYLTLKRKFDELDKLVQGGLSLSRFCSNFQADDDYLKAWHEARLDHDKKTLIGIGSNMVSAEKTLPKTSTTKTVLLQAATEGILFLGFFQSHFCRA